MGSPSAGIRVAGRMEPAVGPLLPPLRARYRFASAKLVLRGTIRALFMHTHPPIARFYRLIEQAPPPVRADRSAGGTLPVRAYRYCDAVTTAAGFGWWVFPPRTFSFSGMATTFSGTATGSRTGFLCSVQPNFPTSRLALTTQLRRISRDALHRFSRLSPIPGSCKSGPG